MSIKADISAVSQDLDLLTGEQSNYLVLRLPNGSVHRVLVSEQAAQEIVQLFVQAGGTPAITPPTSSITSQPTSNELPSAGFTMGHADDGSIAQVFGTARSGDTVPLKESPLPEGLPKPKLVGTDSAGNPILEFPGGIDPSTFMGGVSIDEDGVAQA